MTYKEAHDILVQHNKWRRGEERLWGGTPEEIGEAIDVATEALYILNDVLAQKTELESVLNTMEALSETVPDLGWSIIKLRNFLELLK